MTVENISIDVKTNADRAATKINALSLALERLEGTARTTQGAAQSVSSAMNSVAPAGANAASGAKSAARGIDDVAKSAKKAQSPMGNFISSLKRIAFYRMLRTIIKEISQAIKEGMDNLYEYSKAHDDFGGIASSFDGLASAAQTMKNQLGATFGQMLAAAAPILIQLMQLVTQLTQVFYPLAQAIAALEPVITAVISVVTELINVIISLFDLLGLNVGKIVAQDATAQWKDAKKAAGDYKKTILGFDEINRLNGPGGGGGGTTGGTFESGDFGYKTFDPDKLEWIAVFKQKIDDLKGGILDLVAELAGIPDSVIIELLAKDNATEPLNGLVRTVQSSFPLFATIIMAIQGNPIPFIQTVRAAIIEFSKKSVESFGDWQLAYAESCAEIEDESVSLVGSFGELFAQIDELLNNMVDTCEKSVASVSVENATLESDMQKTFAKITETVNTFVENYQTASENIQIENATLSEDVSTTFAAIKQTVNGWMEHFWQKVGEYQQASGAMQTENSTLGQDVVDTYNRMKNPLNDWISHFWVKIGEYQQASGAMQLENETLSGDVALTFNNIKENIGTAIGNAKSNIQTFLKETLPQWGSWVKNVAENTQKGFVNVAENVYLGLTNAAENIASFVNSASSNVASWVSNTATNIASWAKNIASNIGKALSSAWNNFKDFMSATGQAISGWWSENQAAAITALAVAGVVTAAIAFAPVTGGASLAGLLLAADGGTIPNDGTLFVAGEQGAEIVTNMGSGKTGVTNVEQMKEAVREGNFELLNVVQGGINIIVKAINEIDPDITLDGQSLADKMYHYNQQAANRYGAAMVT